MAGTVTALRTRRPTGRASWPLILLAGEAKTGKTWSAAEFTGDPRVGKAFWIDLGEGCADEYGAVPGADYEIVEHDGTWVQIVESVQAVKEIARAELDAGNKPVMLVIDSMTAEWAMLTEWTNNRAKRSRNNRKLLAENPDAEIDISANYWNDANSRHNRLMNILKTFPGIVVMTSLETEKTQIGPGGRPLDNAPKVAKPDAQKRLPADATVWIRLSLTEAPSIVGIRSVKMTIRPGIDKPQPWAGFNLAELVFDKMGVQSSGAQVRDMPALNADQVLNGEEEEAPRQPARTTRVERPVEVNWDAEIAKCGNDRDALLKLYHQAPEGEVRERIIKIGKELKVKEEAAAQDVAGKPSEPMPEVVDAEIVDEPADEVVIENPTTAKLFDALLDASRWGQVEAISKQITSNVKFARADVSGWFALQPAIASLLKVKPGEALTLSQMSALVAEYVEVNKKSVNDGIDGSVAAVA